MEVNSSPGLEGIESATGKDIAAPDHSDSSTRTPGHSKTANARTRLSDAARSHHRQRDAGRAGQRATIDVPVAKLYTHTPLTMPVHVINGKRPGPGLFVSAAIHGDEINGVEIIRRLVQPAGAASICAAR